jgi:hypothetical protein
MLVCLQVSNKALAATTAHLEEEKLRLDALLVGLLVASGTWSTMLDVAAPAELGGQQPTVIQIQTGAQASCSVVLLVAWQLIICETCSASA